MQFTAGIKAGGWENFTCNGCPRENFLKDLSLTFFLLYNTAITSHTLAFHFAKSSKFSIFFSIQNCFTSKSFEGSSSPNDMLCYSFSVLHSIILHLVTTIQGKTLIFCCKKIFLYLSSLSWKILSPSRPQLIIFLSLILIFTWIVQFSQDLSLLLPSASWS